jgi:hypothetical protein
MTGISGTLKRIDNSPAFRNLVLSLTSVFLGQIFQHDVAGFLGFGKRAEGRFAIFYLAR